MHWKSEILYFLSKMKYKFINIPVHIMSIEDTIKYMSIPGNSLVRFGDGEFMLMNGQNIEDYQAENSKLAEALRDVVMATDVSGLLICMPEPLQGFSGYRKNSQKHWVIKIARDYKKYKECINPKYIYGNAFVSRPYMIYENNKQCSKWFEKLIYIFAKKDITIIEGELSRSGVGNDLFSKAYSIERILCPSQNAFNCYDAILQEALNISKNRLILLAVGPTSKPLALELHKRGYWVLDIGHLDSEYEWYLQGAKTKVKFRNKHSAESIDNDIKECKDEDYLKSIICIIKGEK